MATPIPHLTRNFAPVMDELTTYDLPVTGAVPKALTGWYLRNGPNPHEAASAHWFLGDGMVHGVYLEGGRATSFRNRWVRTSAFTDGARTYDDVGNRDLAAGAANTHVVRHAGRILALCESSLPYQLTPELETVGAYDFGGRLTTGMTAHPKTCPITGELHFFGYGILTPPFLTYHRADAAGNLVVSRDVRGCRPDDDARLQPDSPIYRLHGPASDLRYRTSDCRPPDALPVVTAHTARASASCVATIRWVRFAGSISPPVMSSMSPMPTTRTAGSS